MPRPRKEANHVPGNSTTDAASRLLEFLANAMNHGSQQSNGISGVVEQFKRFQPPAFEGSSNPLVAEEWIREMEKTFTFMECTEAQKVVCASVMLKKGAGHWWDMVKRAYHTGENPLVWTRFKELFLEKYFSLAKRDEKEAKFLQLSQGSLSLVEYERKFDELSRFAPHLVDTEERKARRFERGLRPNLYNAIAVLRLPTYADVLQRVQLIVKDPTPIVTRIASPSSSARRNWGGNNQQKRKGIRRNWNNNNNNKRPKGNDNSYGLPQCKFCGKQHSSECWKNIGACFKCSKMGHLIRDCLEINKHQ